MRKLSIKSKFCYFALFLLSVNFVFSQVGIGTNKPESSTILDLTSEDGAFLLPRLDGSQKVKVPKDGMIIYNKKENCFMGYAMGEWKYLTYRYPVIPDLENTIVVKEKWYDSTNLSGDKTINGEILKVTSVSTGQTYTVLDISCNLNNIGASSIYLKDENTLTLKFDKPVSNVKLRVLYQSNTEKVNVKTNSKKTELKTFGESTCISGFDIKSNGDIITNDSDNVSYDLNVGGDWFTEFVVKVSYIGSGGGGGITFLVSYEGLSIK